jgi:hypothetical protein
MMNLVEKVDERIASFELKLAFLEEELNKEMKKHYKERRTALLDLLFKEKTTYQFALSEFKKLLNVE